MTVKRQVVRCIAKVIARKMYIISIHRVTLSLSLRRIFVIHQPGTDRVDFCGTPPVSEEIALWENRGILN